MHAKANHEPKSLPLALTRKPADDVILDLAINLSVGYWTPAGFECEDLNQEPNAVSTITK